MIFDEAPLVEYLLLITIIKVLQFVFLLVKQNSTIKITVNIKIDLTR